MRNDSITPRWLTRLSDVTRHCNVNDRMPAKNIPDEKPMFLWVERQRTSLNRGELCPEKEALLDDVLPRWRDSTNGDAWNEHILDIVRWRHNHGCLPSEDSTDPFEASLGVWLGKQIAAYRNGKLKDDRKTSLDAALPGWGLRVAENAWLQQATEVAAFHDRHGYLPYRRSEDPYERGLGLWLHNQRNRLDAAKPAHRPRLDTLNTLVPGWQPSQLAA